jgi:DNA-directed RNA polymerase subunit RPC12/RpoP
MKCAECCEDILQKNPQKCPYCGSKNLISIKDVVPIIIAEIENLKKTEKYEEAALKFEELEMWDEARKIRDANMGIVSAISLECPHCGVSQPLSSKTSEAKCKHCGKKYIIPKSVLELL